MALIKATTIYRLIGVWILQPFTSFFPRGDIHDLLTPDLLHQLIKGTFKDHLVDWTFDYIKLTAESEAEADKILQQIDLRYVFPWTSRGSI